MLKPINSSPERYFQTPLPRRCPLPTRLPRRGARLHSAQQLPCSVIRRRVSGWGQPLRPGAPSCPAAPPAPSGVWGTAGARRVPGLGAWGGRWVRPQAHTGSCSPHGS